VGIVPFSLYTRLTMPPIQSLEVIINSHAGFQDKEAVHSHLQKLFSDSGIAAKILIAQTGRDVAALARAARSSESEVVVAAGGDGTINTVASAIVSTDKILGVLPLGTLNHFAQDLHIPLVLDDAVRVLLAGHRATIDVGDVNGHIFVNNSSLGLYPRIVHERVRQQRLGHGKWPAFAWAALSVFRRYPFLDVQLMVQGSRIRSRTPFVFIGNNEYLMEGFKIGRRQRLDGGVLSLYITRRIGRLGLIRLALRALLGFLRNEKDFLAMTTAEATIATRRRHVHVALDGEVKMIETPLNYRVRSGALPVIVPEEAGY
jgi:diacylglycerol kinase family enzyme